jgi:CubicO group peptidase (beta-lactamase class C family)
MRLAILFLAFASSLHAQVVPTRGPLRDFDAYVTQAVRDWEVPGLAVAVVKDDTVVFAKGYGVRALGSPEPVGVHTRFANASTTKAFTSMAVAIMVDEGRIHWDDPLTKHLPTFVMPDPYVTRDVTIRDALSHKVGFGDPSYLWYGVELPWEEISGRLRYVTPASSFRARYAYNNVSYAAAGIAAATVASRTWDDVVRERILTPLGMAETVTQGRDLAGVTDVARPHDVIADTLQVITPVTLVDPIAAAGSMYSSVTDMTRWIRFLLGRGRVDGRPLVSDSAFDEMFRPQTIIRREQFYPTATLTGPNFTAYGLGWFLQDYRGRFVAFHTGSIDGYVTIVGLVPAQGLGVVVFANRDHAELRHALMFRVFDAYLGGPARDWSVEFKAMYDSLAREDRERGREAESKRVIGTSPSLALDAYVGTYEDQAYGAVEVKREGDGLVLVRSPFLTADLTHWHYDTYRIDWRNQWIGKGFATFQLGRDAAVAGLQLDGRALRRRR